MATKKTLSRYDVIDILDNDEEIDVEDVFFPGSDEELGLDESGEESDNEDSREVAYLEDVMTEEADRSVYPTTSLLSSNDETTK